jgi:flagellar hook-associated protein 3 FlgL
MINATSIATASLISPGLRAIVDSQRKLATAQAELSSGNMSDLEAKIGDQVKVGVVLRQEKSHLAAIASSNGVVSARIDASQAALTTVSSATQKLLDALLRAGSGQIDPQVLVTGARDAMSAVTGALNATVDGVHLFAGMNSDVQPIADSSSTTPSAAQAAVGAAFTAAFGVSQSDPAVGSISASAMQGFLNSGFKQLFDSPSWNQDWSKASDQPLESRVSSHQTLATSATANEQPIRDVVRGMTMIADLGIANMNAEAGKSVVEAASKVLAAALTGVTGMQARLGSTSGTIADASDRMTASMQIMDQLISNRESVDTAEVASRISALTTNLQAAYQVVARVQKLSIMDVM